jgi:hypothetical protein
MIHAHLADYFNRVHGHIKVLECGIIRDGTTLFDLAIIISSGWIRI